MRRTTKVFAIGCLTWGGLTAAAPGLHAQEIGDAIANALRGSLEAVGGTTEPPASAATAAPTMVAPVVDPSATTDGSTATSTDTPAEEDTTASIPDAPPAQALRRNRRPPDEDPYAPQGVRVGSFIVKPSLEATGGYDSNPSRSSSAKGSSFEGVHAEVSAESDWSRHAVTGALRGSYTRYNNDPGASAPTLSGDLNARLDVSATTTANVALRTALDSERLSDPNLPAGVVDRPLITSFGGTVGGTWKPNRLSLTVEGLTDRYLYEDARLSGGAVVDNGDRAFTEYQLRLRSGYELTPDLEPFVEATIGHRAHDEEIDRNGIHRDSNGLSAAVGTRYAVTKLLDAEGKIGYRTQRFDDPTLPDLSGLIADGSLVWKPSALTTVRLTGSTSFDETTLPGSSGAVSRTVRLEVTHALRRNVLITAGLGLEHADFDGIDRTDKTLMADLGAEWRFTPSMALRAGVQYERLQSSIPGDDYTATIFQMGLRFRR